MVQGSVHFCSKKDWLGFSSDLNSTAKIRTASFFDHFRSLKNQKRLFMTHPTLDQRTSEYVGIRIDVTTLLNYTEKILNEENNEVFSIITFLSRTFFCFIDFKLNSFILARFVDNILIWSMIENFANICYVEDHFRF